MMRTNLVVALATESRPLIRHFGLSEARSAVGFRMFEGGGIRLVVTGAGRVACAGGVAALGEREPRDGVSAWLNVGVAGHAHHEVGQGVHALSITDAATERCWYPPQVVPMPGRGGAVRTVDVPETAYAGGCVYDMEASAFCAMAVRYATGELVQAYKVISDNRDNGVDTVGKHVIRDAIAGQLPDIERIVTGLSELANEVNAARPALEESKHIFTRWHFTVAQRHQLHELLRRWGALFGDQPVWDADLNRCPSAKSVLGEIQTRLDAACYDSGRRDN